ncbi:MAG: DUF1569 domain-containing protein [Planctomycetota bacterium]
MDSLFDPSGNGRMVERIRSLDADAAAEWGSMSAPQALAHCRAAMAVAIGRATPKRSFIGLLLGGIFRSKIIDGPDPFRRDQPTDPRLLVADPDELEDEKAALVEAVQRFQALGPDGMPDGPHPFFGKLRPDQWDRLMSKHLDHHLRQFGA